MDCKFMGVEAMTTDKWVVYTITHSDSIGRILGVSDSLDGAKSTASKWWRAFDSGDKAEPTDYAGITWQPTADFDQWKSAEGCDE